MDKNPSLKIKKEDSEEIKRKIDKYMEKGGTIKVNKIYQKVDDIPIDEKIKMKKSSKSIWTSF